MMRIIQGDLADPRVVGLLQIHLTNARAATAPGSAHALDISGLQSPDISFWTIWDDEMLLGMGALKRLSADHGEIKSHHLFGNGTILRLQDCAHTPGLRLFFSRTEPGKPLLVRRAMALPKTSRPKSTIRYVPFRPEMERITG